MDDLWLENIPIWVALITIAGALLAHAFQKWLARKDYLNRIQQENYRRYLFSMQRVLTSCIRTDDEARKSSIDEFRSYEAALYVSAPYRVAKQLASLHQAFLNYTRCIRCKYEPRQREKFGADYPASKLVEFEEEFLVKYKSMLQSMRRATLINLRTIQVDLSLASKEMHQ